MTNPLNTETIAYDDLDARLAALFNQMPDFAVTPHLDYLLDDFHADPATYLASIPRLAELDLEALLYPPSVMTTDEYVALLPDARDAYIAKFDATVRHNFASLAITDADLLTVIAVELIDHDCTDCD